MLIKRYKNKRFENKYHASFNEKTFKMEKLKKQYNDLTVGNNEAIATIFINTRVIGQQARS